MKLSNTLTALIITINFQGSLYHVAAAAAAAAVVVVVVVAAVVVVVTLLLVVTILELLPPFSL
jgi:hypothetical protein